eukprot:581724-Amphidinium_carterae.1
MVATARLLHCMLCLHVSSSPPNQDREGEYDGHGDVGDDRCDHPSGWIGQPVQSIAVSSNRAQSCLNSAGV